MISAGQLNRKVSFRRRAIMPNAANALRGGFEPYGASVWAAYKDGQPREITVASFRLQARGGVLTVREDSFTKTITPSDQVELDGVLYSILGKVLQERSDGALRFQIQTAPSRALYAQELDTRGEVVTVRRVVANAPAVEVPVRAIVTGFDPEELLSGIAQGERKVILSAADLEASNFPLPIRTGGGDSITVRGRKLNILDVDDSTHRYAGVLAAYQVRVSG